MESKKQMRILCIHTSSLDGIYQSCYPRVVICLIVVCDSEGDQTYSKKLGHNFILYVNFEGVTVEYYDALISPGGHTPEYLTLKVFVHSQAIIGGERTDYSNLSWTADTISNNKGN